MSRRLQPMRGRKQVELLFSSGTRWRHPAGTLHVIASPMSTTDGEQVPLEYVLIIPRSVCPKAVGRNRIRRLLRESLRHLAQQQPQLLAPYRALALRWLDRSQPDCRRLRLRYVLSQVVDALGALQRTHSNG